MDFITLTNEDRVTETTKVTTGFFTGGVGLLVGSNLVTSSLVAGEKKYYYNLQFSSEDQLSVAYGHIRGSGSQSGSTANKVGQKFMNLTVEFEGWATEDDYLEAKKLYESL